MTGRPASPLAALLALASAALACAVALAPASNASAEEPSPRPEAVPPPNVESVSPTGYRVRVPVGSARVTRGRVFGFDLAEIAIAGGSSETAWGEPALPTRVVLLRVPWGAAPDVRGSRRGARSLGALEPAPVPNLLGEEAVRRRLSPRALAQALSGPAYRILAGAGEAPAVVRVTPMASRGERVLAVTLAPVTWYSATREARIADEIVLDVSWDRPETPLAAPLSLAPGRPVAALGATAATGAIGPSYAPRTPRSSGLAAPRRVGASAAGGPLRVDPAHTWVQLTVPRGGLYRVTPADLVAANVTETIDPATFRLFRANPGDLPESLDVDTGPDSLRECAVEVTGNGDGVFGGGDALYFYASGETGFGYDLRTGGGVEYEETQRTDQEPLWLTWGSGFGPAPPRRIATRDAAPTTAAPLFTAVTHRAHFEQNQTAAFDLFRPLPPIRWERWFMSLIQSVQQTTRRRFLTALPGALPGGAVSIRVRMWGSGSSAGQVLPDHVARIYWNRALADTAGWILSEPQDIVSSGLRTNGTLDSLDIEIPYLREPGDSTRVDVQYLAWYEASYPRALTAVNDTLQFAAPDSLAAGRVRYAIGGATDTTAAWLLDRSDPEAPVRLVNGAWSGAASPFTLTVGDSAGPGYRPRYSLASAARAQAPALSLYAPPSSPSTLADLLNPANEADYLIVAPPAFLAAAESLAVEREARLPGVASPRAAIATTDRIFAQLGGGRPDPVAIRNLLVHASRHWTLPPLYLCLLGDASEDPKNYTRIATPDWVPTYGEYWDSSIRAQFISDDFFAFLDGPGDQLFDLAIGRLPAHDPGDAMALVRGKRATFDRTADFDWWRARMLLSADDAWKWSYPLMRDPVGVDHVPQMERKDAFHIPFAVRREKVYLNDYPFADSSKTSKPKARDAFIAAVNAGNWMVDFIGHGNEDFLADEQVFRSSDLARLTNAARPSIFGFFSCTVGRFDENAREGLAELLLRSPGGGAAVSLAATQEAFGFENSRLNDSFVDALFPLELSPGVPRVDTLRTAGLAWAVAKSAPTSINQVARKYVFLGEPGVTPPLPRGRGVWEKAPLDSIPRGEVAVIRGHALNAADTTRDASSSGTVLLEVLGPSSPRVQIATYNGANVASTYYLPGPVLYRGQTTLDNGSFTLRFVIPTDGRVVGRGTQLRALLSAAGGEGVGLAADSLIIAAAMSPRVDQTPPSIRLRPAAGGDSSFAPGSVLTFEIEDSSGVDLTRFDNAHGIFVIVDDRGTPIDLTSTFRYEPSSYTRGTATLTLPQLSGGAHLLEVHASDAYRNVGVATFIIDVSESAGPNAALTMTEVFNYPNPFPRETYLHARLNRAARLRVQILTVAGRPVRDFTVDGKSGENYIPWDGRDSEGEKVALGVYLVKLTAEASGGNRVTAVARALRSE